jgi:glycolate oxidase iron-sulfur subunit
MLDGCVQPALEPGINRAAAQVLDQLGISAIRASGAGCCGAVAHHLSAHDETLQQAKRNIDAFWPHIEAGTEAIAVTASACASMITEYGHLLRDDPRYAAKAARVSELARDISQIVAAESGKLAEVLRRAALDDADKPNADKPDADDASAAAGRARPGARVAFHSPCTLQHGLKIRGVVESLLAAAGFTPTHVPDSHLCCGSAGTYSILQPALSSKLLDGKVAALEQGAPAIIATANIGCLTHIQSGTRLPVRHWIELIAARLAC